MMYRCEKGGCRASGGYRSNRACLWASRLHTRAALTSGPRPALKTATGELLKHYGQRTVDFLCQGEELRVGFTVVDAKRPILSVSRLMDRGIETFIQAGKQILRRFDGATVELTRRGGLFVLQCQVVVPMLLVLEDEEPAEEAPDLPPVHEEMERDLMGREEVLPVSIEVPAPGEPTSEERRHHGHTHLPYQSWCYVCVRARGRENRHESRSQVQPGTPVIQCEHCFLRTEEDAPMITVLVAIDTVCKQVVAIRDPLASRSLAAFARYGANTMAVTHDACAPLRAATPRTSLVNSNGSNGAARTNIAVESDLPITSWMVRHAAWVLSHFQAGTANGKMAYARQFEKTLRVTCATFC